MRKYRLNLVLAHQYVRQLITDNSTAVRDAVFGTVGTIISFRWELKTPRSWKNNLRPIFTATDLVNLDKHSIYLQLTIDGVTATPFSAITLPPIKTHDTQGNHDKIIRASQERYGKPREKVENQIHTRLSF